VASALQKTTRALSALDRPVLGWPARFLANDSWAFDRHGFSRSSFISSIRCHDSYAWDANIVPGGVVHIATQHMAQARLLGCDVLAGFPQAGASFVYGAFSTSAWVWVSMVPGVWLPTFSWG
jgi:hypothetical protein